MALPIRNSVKVILLNEKNELLLMCADTPKIRSPKRKYLGKFWFLVGGEIEPGESLQEAALREIFEETGILKEKIELGPIVWFGEFDLILNDILTHLKQTFIVAKTNQKKASLTNLTPWEAFVVKKIKWFSLKEIKNSKETIYPILLPKYLPVIISEKYPKKPLKINLAKQPTLK